MAVTSAQDLITHAMQKLLGLNPGESPTSAELSLGLDILNLMLESWGLESLLPVAQIRESLTLTANKSSYTVGAAGGDLTTAYILSIASGFIRDSNNIDSPLLIIPREVYDSLSDKAITSNTGVPTRLFYDPGATQEANQLGTIYLHPIPDAAYTMYLNSNKGFTQFSSLSDTVTFPTGYKRAMIYNLCIEWAPNYGKEIPPEIDALAIKSLDAIRNVNSANKVVRSKNPLASGGGFNILSGQYS